MKHLCRISNVPARAQSDGMCTNIENSTQARVCFVLSLLTDFFFPIIQLVSNNKSGTGSDE